MFGTISLLIALALSTGAIADTGGQSSGGGRHVHMAGDFKDGDNPKINMEAFLRTANNAAEHRSSRLVSEGEFIRLSQEPGTVILDARSAEKFCRLHIAGAINLSFPDISFESLARLLPDPDTRILIYCNNNFENDEDAFPSKRDDASLNLSTYISLYSYGYRNVYELGPLLDVNRTRLPLVRSAAKK
jgi:hypothetical protein